MEKFKTTQIIAYIQRFGKLQNNGWHSLIIEKHLNRNLAIMTNGKDIEVRGIFTNQLVYFVADRQIYDGSRCLELAKNLFITYLREIQELGEKVIFNNYIENKLQPKETKKEKVVKI